MNTNDFILLIIFVAGVYQRIIFFIRDFTIRPKKHLFFENLETFIDFEFDTLITKIEGEFKKKVIYDYNIIILQTLKEVMESLMVFKFLGFKLPLIFVTKNRFRKINKRKLAKFKITVQRKLRKEKLPSQVLDSFDMLRMNADSSFLQSVSELLQVQYLGNKQKLYSIYTLADIYLKTTKNIIIPSQRNAKNFHKMKYKDSIENEGFIVRKEHSVDIIFTDKYMDYVFFNDKHTNRMFYLLNKKPCNGCSFYGMMEDKFPSFVDFIKTLQTESLQGKVVIGTFFLEKQLIEIRFAPIFINNTVGGFLIKFIDL